MALCMIPLQGTCRRDLLSQSMMHSAMDSYAASEALHISLSTIVAFIASGTKE